MKKYLYIIVGVIIIIALSYYIGNSVGRKNKEDQQVKKEIKIIQVENKDNIRKIDSLNNKIKQLDKKDNSLKEKEIEIREKIKTIVIEKPENKDCEDLYYKASDKIESLNKTITIKDSIENNLRNTIVNKDKVISLKDDIIKNKDSEIELVKSLGKKRDKKYSVSIQLGTGATVTKNINSINAQFVPIYVGIGISRNIFSF